MKLNLDEIERANDIMNDHSTIILYNKKMTKSYIDFPTLPRVFKEKTNRVILSSINAGHLISVMRGYEGRVFNYLKTH